MKIRDASLERGEEKEHSSLMGKIKEENRNRENCQNKISLNMGHK
jgi:hypothetical protein